MSRFSPGQLAQMACLLEVTARKPGNVHRGRDFPDLTYLDFLLSASAISAPLDRARELGVGPAVLLAVEATRQVVSTNTNLGIILLLAPLAAIPDEEPWRQGVAGVLENLTLEDARLVYQAIRLAQPGGLGEVPEQDVAQEPSVTLLQAMRLAADRDLVAAQYANDYAQVAGASVVIREELADGTPLEEAILIAFVVLLATHSDTLIARKCGLQVAQEASARAYSLLDSAPKDSSLLLGVLEPLDRWLRADPRSNPGATADIVTAALYVALREGDIPLPLPTWSKTPFP